MSASFNWKKQFCLISECEIEGSATLYFDWVERCDQLVRVLVVDALDLQSASKLFGQSPYLVSAARQMKLSEFVLIRLNGHDYGFASRSSLDDVEKKRLSESA
ncbi:MAG: hypothetical protein GPJ18_19220 [Microcystis aeruginosa F13-15]|jgi:hypothetical protein|nr:hypothetical protein [Microcystis aeruginosa F13-15]